MQSGPVTVYIGVGSNIDPERHIPAALAHLVARLPVTGVSTFYRTAPLRGLRQPTFVNGVWQAVTDVSARELKFGVLRRIERQLGRDRAGGSWAPRRIDLDVLLYGDHVITGADIRVPAPDIRSRAFVALPLLQLAPALVLPDSGERLRDVAADMPADGLEALPELTSRLQRTAGGRQRATKSTS